MTDHPRSTSPSTDDRAQPTVAPFAAALKALAAFRATWPQLHRLDAVRRSDPTVRVATRLHGPAEVLLDVLTRPPGDDPETRHRWERLRAAFDAGVGAGELVGPLQRDLALLRECNAAADALEAMARELRDHALYLGETTATPIQRLLTLARGLARGDFASELVPVTEALREITAAANDARRRASKDRGVR